MTFEQDVERDAMLVYAGALGGFDAVCTAAIALGMKGGPDAVLAHATWLKAPEQHEYMMTVCARVVDMMER